GADRGPCRWCASLRGRCRPAAATPGEVYRRRAQGLTNEEVRGIFTGTIIDRGGATTRWSAGRFGWSWRLATRRTGTGWTAPAARGGWTAADPAADGRSAGHGGTGWWCCACWSAAEIKVGKRLGSTGEGAGHGKVSLFVTTRFVTKMWDGEN